MGLTFISLLMMISLIFAQANWQNLARAVKQRKMHHYARSAQKQAEYKAFIQVLGQNNKTLPQHVKSEIFGYGYRAKEHIYELQTTSFQDQNIKIYLQSNYPHDVKWIALQINDESALRGLNDHQHFILLRLNDYPYDLESTVQHWVLWSNRQIELQLVHQITRELTARQYQTLVYVNEHKYKSIPEIFHAQMFVRKKPASASQL